MEESSRNFIAEIIFSHTGHNIPATQDALLKILMGEEFVPQQSIKKHFRDSRWDFYVLIHTYPCKLSQAHLPHSLWEDHSLLRKKNWCFRKRVNQDRWWYHTGSLCANTIIYTRLQNNISKSEVSIIVWVRPPGTRAVKWTKRMGNQTQCLECKSSLNVDTWLLATSCKRTERKDKENMS